ncbi:MAG: MFS transporter [Thermoleophilia bacterium]|nr:MFS transporter [Thermoleophilia bacterium]
MIEDVRARLHESRTAVAAVFGNRALRRVELARPAAALSVSASNVVFLVVAFVAGGASGVGTLLVVRTLVIAVAAPLGSLLGDRFPRQAVMAAADVVRAAALAAAAVLLSGDPSLVATLVLATVVALAGSAAAPARGALIPLLARTPEELTAANVVASTTLNVVSFVGPATGGVLLALGSPGAGFALSAAASIASAALVTGVRVPRERAGERAAPGRASRFALAGFRELLVDAPTRLVVGIYSAQMFVSGVLAVVIVIAAVDMLGAQANTGFLYSAMGAGGLVGAVLALAVPDRRLGRTFAVALLAWAVPLALVGAWPALLPALVLLALSGAADSVVDVTGLTLLQRRIPNEVFARVGGAAGTALLGAATLGNAVAPFLVEAVGPRWSFVVAGLAVPALAPLWWRPVARLDAVAPAALPAVRSTPLFGTLPLPALEALARSAERVQVGVRETVVRQGEPGDRFYLVVDGEVEFAVDGLVVGTASNGDQFGEIALLRDEPRTATVTALEDTYLFAVAREDFLSAVRGEAGALSAAEELAGARLSRARPAGQLA